MSQQQQEFSLLYLKERVETKLSVESCTRNNEIKDDNEKHLH